MIGQLQKADFEARLGERFEVQVNGVEPVTVELAELTDRSTAAMESFSLLFRGASDRVFGHNTYRVIHPALGEFDLFLGPVVTNKTDGIYYQAVFNRLVTTA